MYLTAHFATGNKCPEMQLALCDWPSRRGTNLESACVISLRNQPVRGSSGSLLEPSRERCSITTWMGTVLLGVSRVRQTAHYQMGRQRRGTAIIEWMGESVPTKSTRE